MTQFNPCPIPLEGHQEKTYSLGQPLFRKWNLQVTRKPGIQN